MVALQRDPEIFGAGVADGVGDDLLHAAEERMGAGGIVQAHVLGNGEVDAGPRHRSGEGGQRGPEVERGALAERAHRGAQVQSSGGQARFPARQSALGASRSRGTRFSATTSCRQLSPKS